MSCEKPLVSVFMITYNHEKFIAQAIEGVLMQKANFPFELIIGEDCSTDRTREIVIDYANRYPEIIKTILHEKNVGAKANVRSVREACRGKYVAICEGDDYWIDPLKLQKQVDFMEKHPDFSMCCHAVATVKSRGKRRRRILRPYQNDCVAATGDIILIGGGFVGTNSIVYRKDLMTTVPEFYEDSSVAGDFKLLLTLSTRGKIYYFDKVMSVYRVNTPGSWTSAMLASLEKREEYYREKVRLYEAFNVYTNYQFDNYVEKAIRWNEVHMFLETGNSKELKTEKYSRYLKSLGYFYLLRQRLKHKFPTALWFYRRLRDGS